MGKRPDLSLKNRTDNPAWRPEVKAKISASRKGKPTTLGKPCLPETKAKIAAALKGKPTGRRPTPEVIAIFVEAGKKNLAHGKGELHPNWKGGLTPQRTKEFRSPEYQAFVKIVLERDNYTCQMCGARNGNGENIILQVHHTTPYAELSSENRYNPDYGITLCWHCHNITKSIKKPKRYDYIPRPRICQNCGKEFRSYNGRKYCPECRIKICCPVCGSTHCKHSARKLLNQTALL